MRPKHLAQDVGHLKIAGCAPTPTNNREGVNKHQPRFSTSDKLSPTEATAFSLC
ncbi:MAG TPA: hypothetical protein VHG71_12250 [Verrucomicrobiae bacterium]|nr:hypothetical protein [Verrucomicrobiae bacterium]